MDYIAPRNMTVASICGRSVAFQKGVPTYCPPQMHADLIAVGVVPAEEIPEEETVESTEPQVPAEREAALFDTFKKIVLRGKREEFTATGVPHLSVLAMALGWAVHAKERDAAWQKFQLSKAEE